MEERFWGSGENKQSLCLTARIRRFELLPEMSVTGGIAGAILPNVYTSRAFISPYAGASVNGKIPCEAGAVKPWMITSSVAAGCFAHVSSLASTK